MQAIMPPQKDLTPAGDGHSRHNILPRWALILYGCLCRGHGGKLNTRAEEPGQDHVEKALAELPQRQTFLALPQKKLEICCQRSKQQLRNKRAERKQGGPSGNEIIVLQ